jgi:predicted GNAT superfamily acetyltransferase
MKSLSSPKATNSRPPTKETRNGITIRHCHGIEEFEACIRVERAVWKSEDIDVVPLPLFVVAAETGGQVLGAFQGGKVVGFALAFAGWRARMPFLHSHMMAVLDGYRDRGIGRRLKLFQRAEALANGIDRIEWTFDPLITKNAYFNFMLLGAIARRYIPNAYGITTSPLHSSLPTDRLVAQWHLRSSRVRRIIAGRRDKPAFSKKAVRIAIPPPPEAQNKGAASEAGKVQTEVRGQFLNSLAKGYAVTAVSFGKAGFEYILEPWSKA